jgi:single-strand DNA-binding protein
MRGVNRSVVVGRVGSDPELRTSKAGNPWCTFSVATNRRKKVDDEWVEETDWHKVKVFGRDAEACQRFLRRGSMVGVEGSMSYEKWMDDEGRNRISPSLLADRVSFLSDLREAPV